MPSRRGQVIAIWSTPNRPKRSITAPITSWPAIRIPIVAVAPMRGWAKVIVSTTSRPIAPPAHIHFGASKRLAEPAEPAAGRRAGARATRTSCTHVAKVSASSTPMREPKRPITATCTEPASPARTDSATASPLTRLR